MDWIVFFISMENLSFSLSPSVYSQLKIVFECKVAPSCNRLDNRYLEKVIHTMYDVRHQCINVLCSVPCAIGGWRALNSIQAHMHAIQQRFQNCSYWNSSIIKTIKWLQQQTKPCTFECIQCAYHIFSYLNKTFDSSHPFTFYSTTFQPVSSLYLWFTWFYFTFVRDSLLFFCRCPSGSALCNMRLYHILCDFLFSFFIHFNCISLFSCALFMRFMLGLLLFNAYTFIYSAVNNTMGYWKILALPLSPSLSLSSMHSSLYSFKFAISLRFSFHFQSIFSCYKLQSIPFYVLLLYIV